MAKSRVPALIGRKEVGAILGLHPNNTHRSRLPDMPLSLQEEYGDEHIAVAATSLWRRADIEAYAAARWAQAKSRATAKS